MASAFDFEQVFRANVPRLTYDVTAHGAESEATLRRNRDAFEWVDVKAGTPVTSADTTTEILGTAMTMPILVGPSSNQGPIHPEGERGMHVGASGAGATMVIATGSTVPFDEAIKAAPGPHVVSALPATGCRRTQDRARARAGGGIPRGRHHRRRPVQLLRARPPRLPYRRAGSAAEPDSQRRLEPLSRQRTSTRGRNSGGAISMPSGRSSRCPCCSRGC